MKALWVPSPNFDTRSTGAKIKHLILHYTGMESANAARERLCDEAAKVSSHYLIDENGSITQMVLEKDRAWHAGVSMWAGDSDINSTSLGVEIHNTGHEFELEDYPEVQMAALIDLCRDILTRHNIAPHNILAHSDIAPSRKQDPGEKFPWEKLFESGIGHWVEPAPVVGGRFVQEGDEGEPVEALQSLLALYGYHLDINGKYDALTKDVVTAFQRHFRPLKVDGVADSSTITTLHTLIKSLTRT